MQETNTTTLVPLYFIFSLASVWIWDLKWISTININRYKQSRSQHGRSMALPEISLSNFFISLSVITCTLLSPRCLRSLAVIHLNFIYIAAVLFVSVHLYDCCFQKFWRFLKKQNKHLPIKTLQKEIINTSFRQYLDSFF